MSKDDLVLLVIVGGFLLLGGVMDVGYSPVIRKIAMAIAIAERGQAEIDSGVIVRNNPGDIEDANGALIQYPTLADGWNALYRQVAFFFSGSRISNPDMTIADIAKLYVGTTDWPNWANTVASQLGVDTWTPINQVTT